MNDRSFLGESPMLNRASPVPATQHTKPRQYMPSMLFPQRTNLSEKNTKPNLYEEPPSGNYGEASLSTPLARKKTQKLSPAPLVDVPPLDSIYETFSSGGKSRSSQWNSPDPFNSATRPPMIGSSFANSSPNQPEGPLESRPKNLDTRSITPARFIHKNDLNFDDSGVAQVSAMSVSPEIFKQKSASQMDPFFTQGSLHQPNMPLNERWVTVFGFPPASASIVLSFFLQYGDITQHVIAPNSGNWMHIQFQSKMQAEKARSKNGKVFNGTLMLGVLPCIDKQIMAQSSSSSSSQEFSSTAEASSQPANLAPKSLINSYISARSRHEVEPSPVLSNTPQKSEGIFSKTVDYIFGW
eukprot:Sdes_comp8912_c0_seq1m320